MDGGKHGHAQDGYALGEGTGEGEYEVAFEANAGSQQATLEPGQVAYIATGRTDERKNLTSQRLFHRCKARLL